MIFSHLQATQRPLFRWLAACWHHGSGCRRAKRTPPADITAAPGAPAERLSPAPRPPTDGVAFSALAPPGAKRLTAPGTGSATGRSSIDLQRCRPPLSCHRAIRASGIRRDGNRGTHPHTPKPTGRPRLPVDSRSAYHRSTVEKQTPGPRRRRDRISHSTNRYTIFGSSFLDVSLPAVVTAAGRTLPVCGPRTTGNSPA
jgi:hypothetical protein